MRLPTFDDWRVWRTKCARLPVVGAFPDAPFPESWLPWWSRSRVSALLETGKGGRFTILAPDVRELLICGETTTTLARIDGERTRSQQTFEGRPLDVLRNWNRDHRGPELQSDVPFTGGLIGYFSYDFARLLEKLPVRARAEPEVPLAAFAIVEKTYVYDHQTKTLFCAVTKKCDPAAALAGLEKDFFDGACEARRMKEEWDRLTAAKPSVRTAAPTNAGGGSAHFSFSKEDFMAAVRRVQDYIRSGDTYQTNLSLRESRPLRATPEAVYEKLRTINPSPYMALLRLPEFSLVSGSPELLVKLRDGKLEARPIAGTRPRGGNADEDRRLNADLIANPKERAEHLMLVDLIRNDIGRVSAFGSVKVTEFMTVESYSHVMHIVSHIEGKLGPDKDFCDAIAATFPGGTITGAPKVRTMEIIEELEPVRRGPYTGSIGWIGFSGEMELNITIRTLLAVNGTAHVQAGAGIVIDSDPAREYQESLNKARALWIAVEAAEAELS